jgi:hypothetical protein
MQEIYIFKVYEKNINTSNKGKGEIFLFQSSWK